MTNLDEPEDGSYVAVRLEKGERVLAFVRDDGVAERDPRLEGRNWFAMSPNWQDITEDHPYDQPQTWQELTELGDIAYVGVFVHRSGKEAA